MSQFLTLEAEGSPLKKRGGKGPRRRLRQENEAQDILNMFGLGAVITQPTLDPNAPTAGDVWFKPAGSIYTGTWTPQAAAAAYQAGTALPNPAANILFQQNPQQMGPQGMFSQYGLKKDLGEIGRRVACAARLRGIVVPIRTERHAQLLGLAALGGMSDEQLGFRRFKRMFKKVGSAVKRVAKKAIRYGGAMAFKAISTVAPQISSFIDPKKVFGMSDKEMGGIDTAFSVAKTVAMGAVSGGTSLLASGGGLTGLLGGGAGASGGIMSALGGASGPLASLLGKGGGEGGGIQAAISAAMPALAPMMPPGLLPPGMSPSGFLPSGGSESVGYIAEALGAVQRKRKGKIGKKKSKLGSGLSNLVSFLSGPGGAGAFESVGGKLGSIMMKSGENENVLKIFKDNLGNIVSERFEKAQIPKADYDKMPSDTPLPVAVDDSPPSISQRKAGGGRTAGDNDDESPRADPFQTTKRGTSAVERLSRPSAIEDARLDPDESAATSPAQDETARQAASGEISLLDLVAMNRKSIPPVPEQLETDLAGDISLHAIIAQGKLNRRMKRRISWA